MFEDLFTRRGIIARYHAAPLHDERLRYLKHCAQEGNRRGTLRAIAAHQVNLVHLLELREGERVSMTRVEAAAGQWSLPGGRRCSRPAPPEARQRFSGHAVRWLRFLGMLKEPHATQHAHAGEVTAFAAQMRNERGWAEETIRGCCHTVDRFFDWLDERGCFAGFGQDHRHRPGGRALSRPRLQPGHDPRLRAASSHLLPVRRTAALVHAGLGRGDHAIAVLSR